MSVAGDGIDLSVRCDMLGWIGIGEDPCRDAIGIDMAVARILAVDISGQCIAVSEVGDDLEGRRGICRFRILIGDAILFAVRRDMGSGVHAAGERYAEIFVDEIFEVLEVAVVGEVYLVREHALHRIEEFVVSVLAA